MYDPSLDHRNKYVNYIYQHLDKNEDPCDDFYKFACSRKYEGEEALNIGQEKTVIGTIHNYQEFVYKTMKELLEKRIDDDEPDIFKMMKQFYKDCNDLTTLNKFSKPRLLKLFAKAGGFPVLEEHWDEDNFTWEGMIFKFKDLGMSIDYLIPVPTFAHKTNLTAKQLNVSWFSIEATV